MQTLKSTDQEVFTTVQASRLMNVTLGAVHQAIKNKRLKAKFNQKKWIIRKSDISEYQKSKYSRSHKFSPEKGEFSVSQAASFLKQDPQRIYYLLRQGELKATRNGCSWVISKDELDRVCAFEHNRKKMKRRKQ